MKLSSCNFLQLSITSSLSGPNILLCTLFPNTLNLCSSLKIGWDMNKEPVLVMDTDKMIPIYSFHISFTAIFPDQGE